MHSHSPTAGQSTRGGLAGGGGILVRHDFRQWRSAYCRLLAFTSPRYLWRFAKSVKLIVIPLFTFAVALLPLPVAANELERPNVVIVFADDLGYGDLSCYGATKIDTPNIDSLASDGMKFTDAHAAASLCSPSRYGLMTGYSPWRLHRKGNGYRLSEDRLTMAGFLQGHGYKCWRRRFSMQKPPVVPVHDQHPE